MQALVVTVDLARPTDWRSSTWLTSNTTGTIPPPSAVVFLQFFCLQEETKAEEASSVVRIVFTRFDMPPKFFDTYS